MEFLEEEARPRFLLHSRPSQPHHHQPPKKNLNKPFLLLCASLSLSLLLSLSFIKSEPLKYLLLWFSLSLLLGPFAPPSLTGGDFRVGQGKPLEEPPPQPLNDEPTKPSLSRRNKARSLQADLPPPPPPPVLSKNDRPVSVSTVPSDDDFDEQEWTDQDFDLLKKQMARHPVGEPRRWDLIAEAFVGRHRVDGVIKMGKSMGERRPSDGDSFSQFLKQRKPLDERLGFGNDEERPSGWSGEEDLALLNALKAFPKEVSMRWEKIAAAVPGRSKGDCMKRVTQLKKDFRSSKAAIDS